MQMPGRSYNAGNYRYGFNGKEKDGDMDGNNYDYGFRIYNPRLVRFLSIDPLTNKYPELTPYQFASNSPIANIDLDGLEAYWYNIQFNKTTNSWEAKLKTVKHSWLLDLLPGYQIVVKIGDHDWINIGGYSKSEAKERLIEITKNPEKYYTIYNKRLKDLEAEYEKNKQDWQNIWVEGITIAWAGSRPKGTFSEIKSTGWEKRLMAYQKYGTKWSKGLLSETMNKLGLNNTKGALSKDMVKLRFSNEKYDLIYDTENNYYRIYDKSKKQYVDKDGNLPATGTRKKEEAKNYVEQQTHIKNETTNN